MGWSRQEFAEFLEALPDAAMVVEKGERVVIANARASELFGVAPGGLSGRALCALIATREGVAAPERDLFAADPAGATGSTCDACAFRRDDGRAFPAEVSSKDITLDGTPMVLVLLRDVTDRKRVEDEVRKSEERLRQAVRLSEIGIFDHDHATDIHHWSARQYEMYGWPLDEPITVPSFLQRLYPDDRAAIGLAIRRAHDPSGDGTFDVEHRILRSDGEIRWIATRSVTLFAGEGAERHPVRTVGASLDFTEKKHSEESLERFRHSIEQASDAIFWIERDGALTYVNEEACRSLGYTREELMRLRLWDIDVSCQRAAWNERWAHFERDQEERRGRAESFHRRKDGTLFPVEVQGQHLSLRGRPLQIAYVRDITSRRHAEESRERLAAILDATPDFVGIADPQGNLLYLNRSARALLGVDDPANVAVRKVPDGHPPAAGKLVVETGVPTAIRDGLWKGETALVDREGREIPVSQVIIAHRDSSGRVAFISTIARDLTHEKSLEAQFLQAQKMEAVGRLAGGVAHDFNNLLSVMIGSATLAARALPADHPSRADIDEVMRAGERAAELTRRMLAFSRKQVLRPLVLNVNEVLQGMAPMMRRLIGEHIELRARLAPSVGRIKADPSHLEQVILNLVVNARDAMARGGTLTLQTQEVTLDEGYVEAHVDMRPGRYIQIAVIDDGVGMDAATRARIFEPFFTTKGPGQGTGLGLSMVFGVVKQSGGDITVQSEPGRGTTFELYFPVTSERPHSEAPSMVPAPVASCGRLILLVEDEGQLRKLVGTVLRRSGYDVLVAPGPLEAIEIAQRDTRTIDLLLTDVVMPQMSGKELADQLAVERPEMRVLFTSGYTDSSMEYDGFLTQGLHFLPKPFTPEVLLATVHKVFEAGQAGAGQGGGGGGDPRLPDCSLETRT